MHESSPSSPSPPIEVPRPSARPAVAAEPSARAPATPDGQPDADADAEADAREHAGARLVDPGEHDEGEAHDEHEEIDDDEVEPTSESAAATEVALPSLSDRELEAKLATELSTLGSMSLGRTNAGALINGVRMPEGKEWISVSPGQAWGTEETIEDVKHCIQKVASEFPDTPPLYIGHISGRRGGYLSPHKSHQAGRDIDISYYLTTRDARWYATANAKNLDVERTWRFVRTLITDTDVDMIFIDRWIQRLLKKYALEAGEDRAWVDGLFEGSPNPIIRHARGHATHLHIRFHSPIARELGRRAYPFLAKRGLVRMMPSYATHTVKRGNTLGSIARRHKTTVAAILAANHLRSAKIRAGQTLRIPKAHSTGIASPGKPVRVPARRLPPSR